MKKITFQKLLGNLSARNATRWSSNGYSLVSLNRGCICSLGLVVLSEEIDGLEVVTAGVESEISVLVEPVSKVEGKVRLGNPGVVGIGNPVPAGGVLFSSGLSPCPGESISAG